MRSRRPTPFDSLSARASLLENKLKCTSRGAKEAAARNGCLAQLLRGVVEKLLQTLCVPMHVELGQCPPRTSPARRRTSSPDGPCSLASQGGVYEKVRGRAVGGPREGKRPPGSSTSGPANTLKGEPGGRAQDERNRRTPQAPRGE